MSTTATGSRARSINIPRPEPRQARVLNDPARFKLLRAGRRFGKTTTALIAATVGHGPILKETKRPMYPGAVYGNKIWWVAPTYTSLNDIWRDLKAATRGAWTEKNEVEHRIELPGGGSIAVRSTDEYENLRGPGLDGLILDEAAYIPRAAWVRVLRPMLADRGGWAMFLFTPNGKNWMYDLEEAAQIRKNWSSFYGTSRDNPRVTEEELEEIRSDPEMTESDFQQEFMAQYVSPSAAAIKEEWFREYTFDPTDETYTLNGPNGPTTYHQSEINRIALVDLAVSTRKTADWFVAQVWGITPKKEQFLIDQVRDRIEGPDQLPTLERIYEQYHPNYFGIESVAYQLSLIQAARRAGLPTKEIKADKDKIRRAQPLISRMSTGKVYFDSSAPYFRGLKKELTDFPNGKYDDQVDAAAYAALEMIAIQRTLLFNAAQIDDPITKVFVLPDYTDEDPLSIKDLVEGRVAMRVEGQGRAAEAKDLESLFSVLAPGFSGDNNIIWHAHVSISKTNEYATIALGRIAYWEQSIQVIEDRPLSIQVPYFEIPLVFKAHSPEDGRAVDQSLIIDFLIALRHIRKFGIASVSFTNIRSAAAVQKLVRAEIAIIGANIDPQSGRPLWQQPSTHSTTVQQNEANFTDLRAAFLENRLKLPNNKFLKSELKRVEEDGKNLLHDDSAATAVAGTIGFLSRYGHLLIQAPDADLVSIEEAGGSIYDLRAYDNY